VTAYKVHAEADQRPSEPFANGAPPAPPAMPVADDGAEIVLSVLHQSLEIP
jgi:hypothetical protein